MKPFYQKILGNYSSILTDVQIVVRGGNGGEFWLRPEAGLCPRVKVGLDWQEWPECVSSLVHELMELFLTVRGYRYSKAPDIGNDHAGCVFHFNHEGLSECACFVSGIIAGALPDLSDAYKQRNKRKK